MDRLWPWEPRTRCCPNLLVTSEASFLKASLLILHFKAWLLFFFSFVFEYGFYPPCVFLLDVFVFLSSSLDDLMSFLMVIPVKVLPPKVLPPEKGS